MNEPTDPPRRHYRLQRRGDTMDKTRKRIARAAFELHATVGPAFATIKAIAEQAGVQRHTVDRHYPDIVDLIRECTAHGMEVTGLPQPEPWQAIPDSTVRLSVALQAMYAYYAQNERLIGNILSDLPVMPELAAGSGDYRDRLGQIWATVLGPWAELAGTMGRAFALWQAQRSNSGRGRRSRAAPGSRTKRPPPRWSNRFARRSPAQPRRRQPEPEFKAIAAYHKLDWHRRLAYLALSAQADT